MYSPWPAALAVPRARDDQGFTLGLPPDIRPLVVRMLKYAPRPHRDPSEGGGGGGEFF